MTNNPHTNKLSLEKSPYLLQHQHNPVSWYAWGEEAFNAARTQNKPIFLSIGYSTCYWCHVMEKDSFEREEVAEVINKYFIPIKVDREERPDVDQIYMDAVVALTGQGGWPMSVFLTPQGKPFWGGTFFYRQQFIEILKAIHRAYESESEKVYSSADQITEALRDRRLGADSEKKSEQIFDKVLTDLDSLFDEEWGGFGSAPKFPAACSVSLLLRANHAVNNPRAIRMVEVTLDRMARGGIYDHLAGGFARYSTDRKWIVPHFEKMLYDNALLAVTYFEAFQVTKNQFYKSVAQDILEYVLREMTSPLGGFFSAQDAGEVGKEGEYYVWSEEEIKSVLTQGEFTRFQEIYQITAGGNFEHQTSILTLKADLPWSVKEEALMSSAAHKLLTVRAERLPPLKDDKVLTSWNGLMISAMSKGYQITLDDRYLKAAQDAASFIKQKLFINNKLLRRYRDQDARIEAFLDDYSFLIEGLLNLYESDFNESWYEFAVILQQQQDQLLWDQEQQGYFYSAAADVIIKKTEFIDNAIPSGNSVSLCNLCRLYALSADQNYRKRALQLASGFAAYFNRHPSAVAKAIHALPMLEGKGVEIAICKVENSAESELQNVESFLKSVYESFLPYRVIAASSTVNSKLALLSGRAAIDGKDTYYICKGQNCELPVTDVQKALDLLMVK